MNDQHLEWIDALKGFGIILVTFAHLNPWLPVETHIYSFHMCLFFFISGFLFKYKCDLKQLIVQKTKSILIPFVVWDLLSSLVSVATGEGIGNTLVRFFVINGNMCWNAPIWFLLTLFITEIIYAGFMKLDHSGKMQFLLLFTSLVLWGLFGKYNCTLKLNLVPFALFFYTLGHTFRQESEGKSFSKAITLFVVLLMGGLSVLFGAILNTRISYTTAAFGNIGYCIIAAVSGTFFYFLIFRNTIVGHSKLLAGIGRNSLMIMVSQYWFFRAYDVVSQKLWKMSVWHERSTIKAVVLTSATILIIMVMVAAFKRAFRDNVKILNAAKYIGIR